MQRPSQKQKAGYSKFSLAYWNARHTSIKHWERTLESEGHFMGSGLGFFWGFVFCFCFTQHFLDHILFVHS